MTTVSATHGASHDHQHDTSLEASFEFLNTLKLASGSLVDVIPTYEDATGWLSANGFVQGDLGDLPEPGGPRAAEALEQIRRVRAALRDIAHAVADERPADPASLAEVNRAIAARERIELVPAPDGVSVGHSHVGDPLDDALARVADPIVDEIRAEHGDRFRICDNETCRWLFYDESRAGRRRWCSMSSCGNRAKAARHRARLKALDIDYADNEPGAGLGPGIA